MGSMHPVAVLVVHRASAITGLVLVSIFLAATIASGILGDKAAVLVVKRGIVAGLFVLVPAMATAAATGRHLARTHGERPGTRKSRRTKVIAANAILVLIPAAVFLRHAAESGHFGPAYRLVQALELAAGAVNWGLLLLNVRDGRRLLSNHRH